jgi:hypothetical protein
VRSGGKAERNQVLPFNKPFRLDCSPVPAGAADERMFAMPCGSLVISGNTVSSWIEALPWGGSSCGRLCLEIETAERSSCIPGVDSGLRSDVTVTTSVPCMALGMDSRNGIIEFLGGWWFGVY